MMACIGRNLSALFKLIKYKLDVFDEVYILFHFNIVDYPFSAVYDGLKHVSYFFRQFNSVITKEHNFVSNPGHSCSIRQVMLPSTRLPRNIKQSHCVA